MWKRQNAIYFVFDRNPKTKKKKSKQKRVIVYRFGLNGFVV